MANGTPAHVPELVIASLQARERGVVISLPAPPKLVRVRSGPMSGFYGLYVGQAAHERGCADVGWATAHYFAGG